MAVPEEMRTSVTLSRKLCVLLAGLAALLAEPIAVQAAQVTKGDELLAPFRFGDDGSGNQSNLPFLLEADETRYEENGETVAADGSVVASGFEICATLTENAPPSWPPPPPLGPMNRTTLLAARDASTARLTGDLLVVGSRQWMRDGISR